MTKRKTKMASLNEIRKRNAREKLLWASRNNDDRIFIRYRNTLEGYDEESVETMREMYGENIITQVDRDSIFKRLFTAFINPFTIVLMILAAVSAVTDIILPATKGGKIDATAVIIVVTMVTISGILSFVQESRSGVAAEKLTEMVETTIAIKRANEGPQEIPIDEIVVGDIIYLAAGDMIPADMRVLRAKDLFISQASLTGESEPVEKLSHVIEEPADQPLDNDNLVFMGSNVVSGSATAIVVNIGDDTIFGSIAQDIAQETPETSFDKGVKSVSWLLIRFMLIMVPVVFFINGFTKGSWIEAFLFAVSIAVGLTPEMLPMIVSANLAKGATTMSKQKVIVKDLNAIQNFGAMDILCTDKTGTLTQDKVILLYPLDVQGNEDERVLRHAFLNSYYQTGLKSLMDVAVIEYAQENGLTKQWHTYEKVDEVPFDFNRRRMSVVIQDQNGKSQMVTKGAAEEMLKICSHVEYNGEVMRLTDALSQEVLRKVNEYNDDGLRVLCVAQKTNPGTVDEFSVRDEDDMVLIGYLAFLDPPKESSAPAIQALHDHGVEVKVLTGDNDAVTRNVCKQVGIKVTDLLLGEDIELMNDEELAKAVEETSVFAKISPMQKVRIVSTLRENGHTIGFMGDGINDASALKEADVGISVDTAVDIAKESANIILLEKDLNVLEEGVLEGRRVYANIIKYIKMTASSNFGNMFAVLAASAFLPFLPMLPLQILLLNLIYDISNIAMPWDNVDADYLKKPRKWNASSIGKFMTWIGPTSSILDIATYVLLFFVVCPIIVGQPFGALVPGSAEQVLFIALFHTGWFIESLWSQTIVIHFLRTPKVPFIQSRASWQVTLLTTFGIAIGTLIPYTPLAAKFDMAPLPWQYYILLLGILMVYVVLVSIIKKIYIKRHGEFL